MPKRKPKLKSLENFVSLEKFTKNDDRPKSLIKEKKVEIPKRDFSKLTKRNLELEEVSKLTKRNLELEEENRDLKEKIEALEGIINNNDYKIEHHKISADNKDEQMVASVLDDMKKDDGYEENYDS